MVDIKQVHLNTFDSDLEIHKRFLNEKIISIFHIKLALETSKLTE